MVFCATIKKKIEIKGITIHSGIETKLKLIPSTSEGIRFRKYGSNGDGVKINPNLVFGTKGSLLVSDPQSNISIKTIEHLLFALRVAGITNIIIENEIDEIPILDGSAMQYYKYIKKAGITKIKDQTIRPLKIKKSIVIIDDNEQFIAVYPSYKHNTNILYSIDMQHRLLKNRTINFNYNKERAMEDLLPARTFGFLKDFNKLKSMNMARGASKDNVVILTENSTLNDLRVEDECLKHKVVDFLGDLYTLGVPVIGNFVINKGSHKLHIALAKQIYTDYYEELC